jgi:hypothetical protein
VFYVLVFELIPPTPFSYEEKGEKNSPLFPREGPGVSSLVVTIF